MTMSEPLYEDEGKPVANVVDVGAWVRSRRVKLQISWRKVAARMCRPTLGGDGEFTIVATCRRNVLHKVEVKDTDLERGLSQVIDRMNHVLAGKP